MVRVFRFFREPLPRPYLNRIKGFSLPEILVSVVILGLLTHVLSEFLNAQLTGAVRYEDAARRIDHASRLRHLINMEVMEAESISFLAADLNVSTECSSAGSGNNALFRLKLANTNSYSSSTKKFGEKFIYYQVRDAGIYRCGPPPTQLGTLDLAASQVYGLMTQSLSLSINSSASNAQVMEYTLRSNIGSLAVTSRVFARSAQIRSD